MRPHPCCLHVGEQDTGLGAREDSQYRRHFALILYRLQSVRYCLVLVRLQGVVLNQECGRVAGVLLLKRDHGDKLGDENGIGTWPKIY